MTSDRSQAYGRVMQTLADLGPSKLLGDEQERLREAADALFFSETGDDADATAALDTARALVERLTSSDRWTEERATELVQDLEACGPAAVVA